MSPGNKGDKMVFAVIKIITTQGDSEWVEQKLRDAIALSGFDISELIIEEEENEEECE